MRLSEIKLKNTREAFRFGMWLRGYVDDVAQCMTLAEQGRYQDNNGKTAVRVANVIAIHNELMDVAFLVQGAKVHLRATRTGPSATYLSFAPSEGTFRCLRIPKDILACHLSREISEDLFLYEDDLRMFQIPPIRLVPMIPHFWSGLVAEFANPSRE